MITSWKWAMVVGIGAWYLIAAFIVACLLWPIVGEWLTYITAALIPLAMGILFGALLHD